MRYQSRGLGRPCWDTQGRSLVRGTPATNLNKPQLPYKDKTTVFGVRAATRRWDSRACSENIILPRKGIMVDRSGTKNARLALTTPAWPLEKNNSNITLDANQRGLHGQDKGLMCNHAYKNTHKWYNEETRIYLLDRKNRMRLKYAKYNNHQQKVNTSNTKATNDLALLRQTNILAISRHFMMACHVQHGITCYNKCIFSIYQNITRQRSEYTDYSCRHRAWHDAVSHAHEHDVNTEHEHSYEHMWLMQSRVAARPNAYGFAVAIDQPLEWHLWWHASSNTRQRLIGHTIARWNWK